MRSNNNSLEIFVITRTHSGFLIHSTNNPFEQYNIRGNEDFSTCTCMDYAKHHNEPRFRCKHIIAVQDMWDEPCDIEQQSFI